MENKNSKVISIAGLLAASLAVPSAFAQVPQGTFAEPRARGIFVEPSAPAPKQPAATVNKSKGNCFLMAGMVSSVPTWRDNGVPIARAQANIEEALVSAGASPQDKKKWRDTVASVYSSNATSDDVSRALRPSCEKMPGQPG